MGIIKTFKDMLSNSKKPSIQSNKETIQTNFERDYDGSMTSTDYGPWSNRNSEEFIRPFMENGRATVSFLKAMGTMEERIRVARDHRSGETTRIVSDLSEVTVEKMIGLYNFEIQEVREKLISTKKYTGNTIKISNSNSAEINLTFKHNNMEIIKTIYVDYVK